MVPRRIVQAKDGTLLVITADVMTPYNAPIAAEPQWQGAAHQHQRPAPGDNPFVPIAAADPSIYALGVRDPQSMAFNPATGDLWIVENEPRGGDELNVINPEELRLPADLLWSRQ